MGAMASRITSLTIVYSSVCSGADQRKHQNSASLAFVWGIHRGPVNSPHKWPVTRKIFPFDEVIMHLLFRTDNTYASGKMFIVCSDNGVSLVRFRFPLNRYWLLEPVEANFRETLILICCNIHTR